MKKVRKFRILGLALLGILFVLKVSAQGGPGRGFQMTEDDIKEQVRSTANTLKMNDDQSKKALAVEMDFYNKMQIERQKMMNAGGPPGNQADREAMRDKMMKMRDDRNAEYEKILSPDQYKQFIDMQEQRMREMREQRQQMNPGEEGGEERPARGRGRG
jgi:hypothetical protein